MSQRLQPIPRRYHKKSFTGCRECKKRKVKCDETRPLCKNCAKHFINIDSCQFDSISTRTARDATKASSIAEIYQVQPSCESLNAACAKAEACRIQPPYSGTTIAGIVSNRGRHKCLPSWHGPSLPPWIGSAQLDPFDSHPGSAIPDVDDLLSHFLSTFVLRNFLYFTTCPMVRLWWPLIQSDTLLFHVALLLSSLSLEESENLRGGHRPRHLIGGSRSRQLQAECIRQLTERVRDETLGISDQTIVAVANLAAIEHERGNIKMVQMHMSGLKRMVSMRGGLNSVRDSSPLAANIAFWMSMVAMNEPQMLPEEFVGFEAPTQTYGLDDNDHSPPGMSTPEGSMQEFYDNGIPNYELEESPERLQTIAPQDTYLSYLDPALFDEQIYEQERSQSNASSDIFPPSFTLNLASDHPYPLRAMLPCCSSQHYDFYSFGINTPFSNILLEVQHLTQRFATIIDYSNTNSTVSILSELCFLLQRLLRLPLSSPASEASRFAAAIQLISPLWGYYPNCTLVVNGLLHKLTGSLKSMLSFDGSDSPAYSNDSNTNNLLLWLFSVGAAEADLRMPEHDWFVNQLVVVVSELEITDWNMMKGQLVRFIWHDIFCEGPFRDVWEEVRKKRTTLRALERDTLMH